jgi:hypothetical protein
MALKNGLRKQHALKRLVLYCEGSHTFAARSGLIRVIESCLS